MAKIKAIDNHLINEIKRLCILLEIGQKELSRELGNSNESNLVGIAENNGNTTGYSDHHLNIFAIYFSKIAKEMDESIKQERGIKDLYTISDFYPTHPIEDVLVEKDIRPISLEEYPSGAINILVKETNDFLKSWRTIKEICDYCNNRFNKVWKSSQFSGVLVYAEKIGLIARESENSARYKLIE